MEKYFSIPTDNIYKFLALFGLAFTLFLIGLLVYLVNSSNEVILNAHVQAAELQTNEKRSPRAQATLDAIEKRVEITVADKEFGQWVLRISLGCSLYLMGFGFVKWARAVQPLQDELMRVQLELQKLQLEKLRREVQYAPVGTSTVAGAKSLE